MFLSYRGPPAAAAQMCAATPILTTLFGWVFAAQVRTLQHGLLQRIPTRYARSRFVLSENSSLLLIKISTLILALSKD